MFLLEYTDTQTERGAGGVTLSVDSFEPVSPVPAFDGSGQAHFQIPNRYLMLENVGDVVVAPDGAACGGAITAVTGEEGQSFDNGVSRTVADVTGTCGVGVAS